MPKFDRAQIREILIGKFGPVCWGCGLDASRLPHGECHLQVDHINPVSSGGPMAMGNAAILCGPCNQKKGDRITLVELRRRNIHGQICNEGSLLDLDRAIGWSHEMYRRAQGPTVSIRGRVVQADVAVKESPRPPWWKRYDPD